MAIQSFIPSPKRIGAVLIRLARERVTTKVNVSLKLFALIAGACKACEIRIARIFNTCGPRMLADEGGVVSNFIVQALRNEPLTLYGDGSQTRSFCYVDVLIEGLIHLMNGDYNGSINLGDPNEFTIRQLAEQVRTRINPELPLI